MPLSPPAADLVVLAGPSTSGKDSLLKALREARPNVGKPVTTTTRAPRPGEISGVHYHFLDRATFQAGLAAGDFVEHNVYNKTAENPEGDLYGLTYAALRAVRDAGKVPVVILDPLVGVPKVQAQFETIAVFVEAPIEVIEARLRAHRSDLPIEGRLATARQELAMAPHFEHRIRNDGALADAIQALLTLYDTQIRPRFFADAPRRAPARY